MPHVSDPHHDVDKLDAAFALVDPSQTGPCTGMRSWKDPIRQSVTSVQLAARGLTIADVQFAVQYYTATDAHVRVLSAPNAPETLYLVTAAGYRAGPAGDH
jgi:hypothetical protein